MHDQVIAEYALRDINKPIGVVTPQVQTIQSRLRREMVHRLSLHAVGVPYTVRFGQTVCKNAKRNQMGGLSTYPAIELFAHPGGLGEGFCAFHCRSPQRPFRIRLTVENNEWAHPTLRLRSFFREYSTPQVSELYYELVRVRS